MAHCQTMTQGEFRRYSETERRAAMMTDSELLRAWEIAESMDDHTACAAYEDEFNWRNA